MASVQVTTGVIDQSMYSQGWRGNSGDGMDASLLPEGEITEKGEIN
jgi:hypothetical protein